jgi:hypothetical protein
MMSYNWDHQDTILRVVKALQLRGYRMWVDVEQMKGSTVDVMAAAVEDAEVMLIGVSRAYKESSNCRMEAQYAMQREVDTVPLMLVDGYQADGWLGMLIGTRMWYAFYGGTLTESSLFEGKVEELCRELGQYGRGRYYAPIVPPIGDGLECADPTVVALPADLSQLKVAELRKRALAAGVNEKLVEDALDADEPKAVLMELVVMRQAEAGSSADLLLAISAGGEVAVGVLVPVLEHASDVLDALSASTPRRSRRGMLEVIERVESVCELVDASSCNGIAQCGTSEVEGLVSWLVCVQELDVGTADAESVASVSELLKCLARCESAVLQSLAVLKSDAGQSEEKRVSALEVLRGLPCEHLEAISSDEVSAVEVVLGCMKEPLGAGVRGSACMALFALGCRNGVMVCGTVDFMRAATGACNIEAIDLMLAALDVGESTGEVLELLSAAAACFALASMEALSKVPPGVRAPLEVAQLVAPVAGR